MKVKEVRKMLGETICTRLKEIAFSDYKNGVFSESTNLTSLYKVAVRADLLMLIYSFEYCNAEPNEKIPYCICCGRAL